MPGGRGCSPTIELRRPQRAISILTANDLVGKQTAPGKPTRGAQRWKEDSVHSRGVTQLVFIWLWEKPRQAGASDKPPISARRRRPGYGGRPTAPQAASWPPTTLVTPSPRQQKSDTRNRQPKPEPRPDCGGWSVCPGWCLLASRDGRTRGQPATGRREAETETGLLPALATGHAIWFQGRARLPPSPPPPELGDMDRPRVCVSTSREWGCHRERRVHTAPGTRKHH